MMRVLVFIVGLICGSSVAAIEAVEMFDDPEKEARARDIGSQLRCLVCRNQSIFDSNAGLAYDLRVAVRERIQAGDSDQAIFRYVQERFGDYVLLEPPVNRHTVVLWLTPIVLMGIGSVVLGRYVLSRQRFQPNGSHETRT